MSTMGETEGTIFNYIQANKNFKVKKRPISLSECFVKTYP